MFFFTRLIFSADDVIHLNMFVSVDSVVFILFDVFIMS